ncbi:MAG: hypothetical protein KGZ42_06015, partial [Melioribacter sp.]|nr:hypothetical protein [Melioribacter sp.]
MKPVVCIYCEGTDTKIAVVTKEKGALKVLRVASLTMSSSLQQVAKKRDLEQLDTPIPSTNNLSFDSLDEVANSEPASDTSDVGMLQSSLFGLKLNQFQFIPIITEPIVNYHMYDGPRDDNRKKLLQLVVNDIQTVKGITVDLDSVDVTELNDKAMLSVFIEGEIPCVHLVNLLANYNNRRYFKIPTVKTAELSLAYYVSKTNKFFPEDNTLIIYIGKEYSKLIFLEGQKLKHIGATLDIGTKNLHTYDVYF